MEKFDLIVIGAGPGGYEAAAEAASVHKKKVALIERSELGGTCLNRGCIPTKAMLHSAHLYHELHANGEMLGLTNTEAARYDMEIIQQRKREVVSQLVDGVAGLMKKNKVTVFTGTGTITGPNQVSVALVDGGTEELEADHILIATGSVPSRPPIPGVESSKVYTSDEMLELSKPIESLVIIGGGVIGCEFASVFTALGVKVTIVEALPQIIATMDKEVGRSLAMIMKKKGIDLHTNSMVTEIKESGDQVTCCFTEKDEAKEVSGDIVLLSIGRRANTEGLFPGEEPLAGIEMDRGKILVNETYQTGVPSIYAIGDVIGGIQLAHVATAEGRIAVAAMYDAPAPCDPNVIPSCIYTNPEIASVGLNPDQAKADGIAVITKKYSMGANGKSVLSLSDRGFIKVIADKETHKVLGAEMMCLRATDMIAQFAQAITCGLTLEDMSKVVYPHPTFSEGIGEVLK